MCIRISVERKIFRMLPCPGTAETSVDFAAGCTFIGGLPLNAKDKYGLRPRLCIERSLDTRPFIPACLSQACPQKGWGTGGDSISLMDVFCLLSPEPGQPPYSRATLPRRQRGFVVPGLKGRRKSGATSGVLRGGLAWALAKVLMCSLRGRWGLRWSRGPPRW